MSAASRLVAEVEDYQKIEKTNLTFCPQDEPILHTPERASFSFLDTIVGRRGGLRAVLTQVEAVAPTGATVLITGETGTGKEVIASAIQKRNTSPTHQPGNSKCE